MTVDLNGQVALVTGAARNIGKAIADVFAQNGARVVYADILHKEAEEAAAQYRGCKGVLMDVTQPEQIEAVVEEIYRDCGRIDILVNNAGVNTEKHRVTIDKFPRDEWDRILGVDLTGLYTVSKVVAQRMAVQGTGRIINIASVVGLVPLRLQCAFAAAKAGVVNLTKAMALELSPRGILVNGIAPGSIQTEGTERLFYGDNAMFKERYQQMLAHIPLGKPGQPEDIAFAALYLAAPESCYVNGHVLTVDGGWTAGYTRNF